MGAYITFSRRTVAVLFAGILLLFLVCGEIYGAANKQKNANTPDRRLEFVESLGVDIKDDSASSKYVTIPQKFSDVYENYNLLQMAAGYNLNNYKGVKAVLYTYPIETPEGYSGECVCNILVYNGRVIGGDISSVELGGFMLPLMKP